MKLRIQGNSIRLRLTDQEIKSLQAKREIIAETHFGLHEKMIYSLHIQDETSGISASFSPRGIAVILPRELAANWLDTEEISISANQHLSENQQLHILIEKDLPCKHPKEIQGKSGK